MGYKDSRCDYVEVVQLWRVYVPSERAWNKTIRELPGMIQPQKQHFYQPRVASRIGHQIDLLHSQLTVGEDQLSSSYPDW